MARLTTTSRTLGEAVKIFIGHMRQHGATEKHVKDAMVDFRLLQGAFGTERPVRTIGGAEAGKLWEVLRALPARSPGAPELPGADVFEKAKLAREQGLEPMHWRTANSYLARWRKLFDQEVAAGQAAANPFVGKSMAAVGKAKQQRTFADEELATIFGNALFQGAHSEHHRYAPGSYLVNDWMFWAPLVALLSGARIGEIAQLRPADARQVHGHLVIDINAEAGKTLKNEGTARRLPVHSHLIDLGFLQLADARRKAGDVSLLPGMPKPVHGDPGAQPSKWMSERFLPRIGVKDRKGLGFHSFRHTLKTLFRNAGVPDSVSNSICGHDERSAGVAQGYGQVQLEAMSRALQRITLPDAVLRIPARHAIDALDGARPGPAGS
ncbi:site-specific integrase [Falsiroseomonas sp.]|uniref:site-specific integrase n=1 Tax=Falsiroseomonas sp. TaxID=2870721 RepID=UPI003566CBD3